MMSDLPPAYDYITMEPGFYDQLTPDDLPSYLSPPDLVKTGTAMTKYFEKHGIQKSLTDEVKALGDSVVKVDEAFERVRQELKKIDTNDYKDKDGKPIPKFQSTWVDFQTRWTTLLWDSRDIVIQTGAYIPQKFLQYKFSQTILPVVEGIEARDNLDDANLEQKYSQDFIDLRRDLENFKRKFDEGLKHQTELAVAIENQAAILNSKIKRLDKEIMNCIAVVITLGIASGATIYVTFQVVGTLAGLGSIGPSIATGVMIIVAIAAISSELGGLMAYTEKTKEKKEEQTAAQKKLQELQVQLTELKALQAILENQKTEISEICGRLGRFGAIWETVLEVRHDVRLIQLELGLNAAVGD